MVFVVILWLRKINSGCKVQYMCNHSQLNARNSCTKKSGPFRILILLPGCLIKSMCQSCQTPNGSFLVEESPGLEWQTHTNSEHVKLLLIKVILYLSWGYIEPQSVRAFQILPSYRAEEWYSYDFKTYIQWTF